MRLLSFSLIPLFLSTTSHAEDIAQCFNPRGTGYYPNVGIVSKQESGWVEEAISDGQTSLVKIGPNDYDILFIDATKRIVSSKNDGGTVMLLSLGKQSAAFLVVYPGKTAEIYTFINDNAGTAEYLQVTSRAGDDVMFPKSTVMRGDCVYVNLHLIN